MKIFQIISWATFFVGIIFKFLHFPGGGILCTLGFGLIFMFAAIFLYKNVFFKKENKETVSALLHFSFAFLTLYILFRVQFWPGQVANFLFAMIVSTIYFVLFFIDTGSLRFRLPHFFLIAYFAVAVFLYAIPGHKIYYAFHYKILSEKTEISWSYEVWNMYSWFLYTNGEYDKALEANHKAQKALANNPNSNDYVQVVISGQEIRTNELYIRNLRFFEQRILDKTWIDPYIEVPHFGFLIEEKE